ncbi:hypothetical protein [Sagittula sp. S175]|uniref:hypothetical protein n=1 Tax=Sagittula sp. S175 TaxID=3415129 RepID=UPI003C79C2F7
MAVVDPKETLGDLPTETVVTFCPEVARDIGRALFLSADLDLSLSAWCGVCRFDEGQPGALADLLDRWPMLARQGRPEMGQRYERVHKGVWLLREDLG